MGGGPKLANAKNEPFPSKWWHCACLVLLAVIPPIYMLVENASEATTLWWTLGLTTVLVLLGFVNCAYSMSQMDEDQLMDVGGDMAGFVNAVPLLLALVLWFLEIVVILVCRAVLSQPVFTHALGRHLLILGGVFLLGLAIDCTRDRWSKLLPEACRRD